MVKRTILSPSVIFILIASLAGTGGCNHAATVPDSIPVYSLVPKPFPRDLGRIGIVSSRSQPEMNFKEPKGRLAGAVTGAGRGAAIVGSSSGGGGTGGGGGLGDAAGGLLYPFVVLAAMGAGAVVGGTVGAIQGESAKAIRDTEATLNEAIIELRIQEIMRDLIYESARRKAHNSIVLVEDTGPGTPDERTDYLALRERGINTVLEVRVLRIGLWGETGINPRLNFFMTVNAKCIRIVDSHELYDRTFRFEGAAHKFVEWGLNDGEAFRGEFERGCHSVANEIAEQLGSR